MAKRNLPTAIEKLLVSNEPFEYAHLVKYERPFDPKDGEFRTNEKRYVYLTDGSRDIQYHGITYVANRLVTVGGYAETTEARATNMSLTLSGEPVGLTYTLTAALSSSGTTGTLTSDTTTNVNGHVIDFVEAGFIEGDAVKIEKANGTAFSDGDSSKTFIIKNFSNENRTFTFERTGTDSDDSSFVTLSDSLLKLSLDSAEVKGPLNDTGGTNPSFLNREVYIYKVFFDADDPSTFVGDGAEATDRVLVFKGIISSTNIQESPNSSKVQWNLTSHWGDFEAIQGRITTDEIHRALDANGKSNISAALRPEYARDLGFLHAESSLNTIATYQTSETRYKYKTKKKWFKSKVKEIPYEHIQDHDVDLSVFLSGKYLPVIYGVNRVPGVPVFADTSNTDAKEVYVAYAISEGENHGLYNLYIDGAPLICVDESDSDVRSTSAANSDSQGLQCYGRMDQGATLGGQATSGTTTTVQSCNDIIDYQDDEEPTEGDYERYADCMNNTYVSTVEPTNTIVADDNALGIQHEEFATISHPYDMKIGFHSGRPGQLADNVLVTKAANNGFKRQNDYYSGTERYWGPDHRLLDTCYTVLKFTIDADSTTVPEVEYVVKGKVLENYNYDGTYVHDAIIGASDNHANFTEGDSVTVEVSSDGSSWSALSGTFRILDKYNFETARGTSHYRFRLDNVPDLTYVDGAPTKKYLRLKSSSNYWHMLTYNNNLVEAGNWSTVSSANTIQASSIAVENSQLVFTLNNTNETKLQAFYPSISNSGTTSNALVQFSGSGIAGDFSGLDNSVRQPLLNTSNNKVTISNLSYGGSNNPSNINLTPATVFDFSAISAVAGITNTAGIVGSILEIIETGEEREITGFNTSTNMVTIVSPFITPPTSIHTFNIKGRGSDKRSSINPAIQTTDILTNEMYGKGLSITNDIDLATVKTAALLCDTRSDVTLYTASTATVKQNDIYKLTKADGSHLASGRVVADVTNGTAIKFDEISGKFLRGYQNYINYNIGDIIYNTVSGTQRFYRVTGAGYKNTAPTHTSGTTNGMAHMSAPALTKVSGNGSSPASITLASNGAIPLYSLYDSDFVKYWRYLGWEENRQWCVTRHQTNGMMDTAKSVFSNLNAILSQYNGILSYSNGKYELSVETNSTTPVSTNTFDSTTYDWNVNPEYIEHSDIIGTINLNDNSQKNSKNTVKGSIFDPQNNFQSRSITFYNSDFLKADRNVIKTGNMTLPAVSSYYNARMTIEKYLLESRFSKEISFTLGQKGLLLKPGQVISLNYEPFGFSNKLFRVSNLNYQSNCTVSVKATEYDDSFYIITPQRASKAQQATLSQRDGVSYPGVPTLSNPTTTKPGVITLAWSNGTDFSEATDSTQIWRATSQGSSGNVTDHATLITTVDNTTTWSDAVGEAGTFYYWIRHVRKTRRKSDNSTQLIFKEEFSTAINAGKQGVAKVSSPQLDVDISSIQIKFNDSGVLTPTGTAQDVKLTATLRNITPASGVVFSIVDADQSSQTDVQFTNGATTLTDTSAPFEATLDASSASNATTNKFVKAVVTDTTGEVFTELVPVSVTKDGSSGSTGVAAAAVSLSPSTSVITYSANDPDSENPSTTISFTTTLQGNTGDATSAFSGTPYYEFIVDGTTKANTTTSTFTLADSDEPADQETVEVQVKVRDGGTTGAIKATDSVTIFGIKSGSDAVTAFLTNSAHTVSAATNGDLASGALTNAGGTFKVFVGSTDKTANCSFSEVSNEETSGLTSSINTSTGVYTISGLTVDLAKNVFRATIPASISPTGIQMTIDQTYSISKSRNGLVGSNGTNAKTVKITSDKYAIAYNAAGTSPNPSSAFNLIASTQGFVDPYFKFTGDGITNETSFTDGNNSGAIDPSDTFSFTPPSSFFSTPKILKVEVVEADDTSTILASDSIAIYAVQPGAAGDDAFTVICTNESHAIPADADGSNPVMTGSGTTFQVFKGNSQLTGITSGTPSATQFKVTVDSDTNITVGSQSASSNNIVFTDHSSLTSDTADIVYTVNIANTQSITKKQTFSRTNKGTKGDDGDPGTAALSGLLTNESFTAQIFSFFAGSSFINYVGGGGDFKIFQGTSELTSSLTFGISGGTVGATTVTKTQNGLTMTINKTTGIYSVAGQSWTSDAESFTLTGTSGSTTINKVYNINKTGLEGKTELTATAQAFNYDGASANPSPSSITLTASAPGFLATYGTYSYKFSKSTNGGSSYSQVQAYSATNTLSISPGNFSTGNEVYKVEVKGASYSSSVIDEDTITILRLKDGATGPQGNNDPRSAYVQIFNPSNSVAAITAPTDTTSGTPYNFETGVLTIGSGGTSGWTQTRPTSFPYWFLTVKITESSYEGAQTVDYQVLRRLGGIGIRDEEDLDLDITDDKIRFRFDSGNYRDSGNLPGSIKNAQIEMNTDGTLNYAGNGSGAVSKAGLSLDYFDGANKTEFQSGSTDGSIQLKNNNAGTFTDLEPFSTTELQKLTNLRAGKVPGTGSGATTASIANEDIDINTTTGILSGIGTGNNSRVFNDLIEIDLATSGANQGRISLTGIGTTNTTVDVTKGNLGLSYDDGATVGAVAGTNLKQADGTVLNNQDVRNDDLDIDYSGTTVRIKKGTTVIQSAGAPSALKNADVTATDIGGAGYVLPASAATVGATAGTDLKESDGTTLSDEKIKNDSLSLAFSGTNIQIKRGSTQIGSNVDSPTALKNSNITVNATSGKLENIGTADVVVNNGKVTVDSDGKLVGIGTANVKVNNEKVTIAKDANGTISLTNANSATISLDNADVGLSAVTNHAQIKDDLSNLNVTSADLEVVDVSGTKKLQAKDALKNAQIKIKADGTLRYDGGVGGTPSLASIAGTVPRTKGGFGTNVDTLFGSTVGRFPRWNGTAFVSVAEDDFKNSELSSSNVTGALGFTPGTSNFSGSAADLSGNLDPERLSSTDFPQKSILTAATNALARSAIGAGTSSFAGTQAAIEAAITNAGTFRSSVGAGTSNFAGTQAAIEAAITNAGTFRSSVGAGTSNFSGSAADLSGNLDPDRLDAGDFPTLGLITAANAAAAKTVLSLQNVPNVDATDGANITAGTLDVAAVQVAGSTGFIGGVAGQSTLSGGNLSSIDIEVTELSPTVFGANGYPKHVAAYYDNSFNNPAVTQGSVIGGSPRFNFTFTTHNWGSGTRDFLIMTGLDFVGSSSSNAEALMAVAMRATTSATGYTSATASDYLFTDRTSGGGSNATHPRFLNAKVSLSANTQYYIWMFALGDDGMDEFDAGFINVFGIF